MPIPTMSNTGSGYSGYINVIVDSSVAYSVNVKVGSAKAVLVKNNNSYKTIKANANDAIQIAVAGDKKAKVWASEYTDVGKAQ